MRDVASHQRVDGRERGLDRLAVDHVTRTELGERVFELVLAREHAHREWLPSRRVDGVFELFAHHAAHGGSYCLGGVVVHSLMACFPGRSM